MVLLEVFLSSLLTHSDHYYAIWYKCLYTASCQVSVSLAFLLQIAVSRNIE